MVDNLEVPNSDFVFDLSLEVSCDKIDELFVVYQIVNSNDSTIIWKNFGVNNKKHTQAHIHLNKLNVSDSVLYFKSYLWNKYKVDLTVSNIEAFVHKRNKNP